MRAWRASRHVLSLCCAVMLIGLTGCATETAPEVLGPPVPLGGPLTPLPAPTASGTTSPEPRLVAGDLAQAAPGETILRITRIAGGTESLDITGGTWGLPSGEPTGSKVEIYVTPPDGAPVHIRELPGAKDFIGTDTDPDWHITDPTPGEWIIEARADFVPEDSGLWVRAYQLPSGNLAPVFELSAEVDGLTVTVTADGSHDPDGTLTLVGWDFGSFESTSADLSVEGPVETHWRVGFTFPEPGTYWIEGWVADDDGVTSFGALQVDVA